MRLNKIFIAVIAALASLQGVSQSRDNEFSVSYGAFPASNYIATYRDHFDMKNSWGSVSFAFDRNIAGNWKIGVSYTLSTSPGLENKRADGKDLSATWHSLMAGVRYTYWRQGNVSAYARAAAGVTVLYLTPDWRDSYNTTRFAFQVSPVGLQYDFSRYAGAFIEAGMGIQGIVQAGLRVGF